MPLAAALVAGQTSVVRGDVALAAVDAEVEAVVGSFTVDGLTYAIDGVGEVALVAVSSVILSGDAERSGASPFREGEAGVEGSLSIPPTVSYAGVDYVLVRIAPLAFDGAAIVAVSIPETVRSIDSSAALGCESLAEVSVSEDNPDFSTFDGYLTDKAQTSILLVPEGRIGQVRIPSSMQSVDPRAFSHCARIDAFAVDADCPGLASWSGSIYTKDLAELVRVPAGATELTLPAECSSIGPSALSGCTELRSIEALGTVANIAPSAFGEIEEVEALPSTTLIAADEGDASERHAQVTGLVAVASNALSSIQVDKSAITVTAPEGSDLSAWETAGINVKEVLLEVDSEAGSVSVSALQSASTYDATYSTTLTNLTNSTAYPKWRGSAASWGLQDSWASWPSASWTIGGGASRYLTSLQNNVIGSSALCGGKGDYIAITDGNGAWISWFTSNTLTTGSTSTIFFIYFEEDAKTVLSKVKSPMPSKTYLYRSGSSTVNRTITWDAKEGSCDTTSTTVSAMSAIQQSPVPVRSHYRCTGWYVAPGFPFEGQKVCDAGEATGLIVENRTLEAHWERVDYDISFDVDSEPADEAYVGVEKPEETVNKEAGQVAIEDPKRPGYVFQGWVIPNGEGTEAIDQELVYQGDDGKWYVDAEKLPDYATDGKVELTARWTSIISVDVPSAVTFYADVVTQDKDADDNQKSLDGAADNAFGQAKVTSQSQVDLRIVGLESEAAEGDGTNSFGASDVLVDKASASVPASSGWKLFSLFPSSEQFTADDLKDKAHVSAQPEGGVTFDIDDVLLEKSFSADDFTIPAGETLNLGYRLNLKETQQALDYDKLSTLEDGQSASIANVSYCFAADYGPVFWTEDDDGLTMTLADIKADAEAIAAGDAALTAKYTRWMEEDHRFHIKWYDKGISEADNPTAATIYDMRIIGINHDDKSDGTGKAGLTFQFVNFLSKYRIVNTGYSNAGGWGASTLCKAMNSGEVWEQVPLGVQAAVETVDKKYYAGALSTNPALKTSQDKLFLASYSELTYGNYASGFGNLGNEGTVYEYWARKRTSGNAANASLVKYEVTAAGTVTSTARSWWLRSPYISGTPYCFAYTNGALYNNAAAIATGQAGTVVCFCL